MTAMNSKITSGQVRKLIKRNNGKNGFLLHMLDSAEARETVKGLLNVQTGSQTWSGYNYVPPGSAMETIAKAFEKGSDVPLEIPFHGFMFYLAGYLMQQGTRINFCGRNRTPEIWTVVLAPSGCGKTFATKIIGRAAPVPADFPECASGAKMLDAMAEHEAKGKIMLWLQDEFAQKLKQMETAASPLADAKDYLLRAYDGTSIERNTRSAGSVVVKNPCLSILGLNTDEGFFKSISPESLVDGFAQRFGYVLAKRDPKREMVDHPMYDEAELGRAAEAAFKAILAVPLHPVYHFDKQAEAAYCTAFQSLANVCDIPQSFYRRVMFRTVKYALFYHLILGKSGNIIDPEDIGWASRLLRQQILDARSMLVNSQSDLSRMINAAETLRAKLTAAGKPLTPRDIARGVHGVKSAAEAKGLMTLLADPPPPLLAKAA